MLDAIGWVATGVFSISYFVREQAVMLRVQAAAACLWIAYGLAIGSTPVIAANAIVAVSAVYSAFVRSRRITS
jgi:uncharacterized protein with PQ loop repeat